MFKTLKKSEKRVSKKEEEVEVEEYEVEEYGKYSIKHKSPSAFK